MRNQPFSDLELSQCDGNTVASQSRLKVLALGFVLCFGLIAARVIYIQSVIANRFVEPWTVVQVERTQVPARDGRILSRDGAVLAFDETIYDVLVDYRWLESPPNPLWLRREISQRLPKTARGDEVQRKQTEQAILQDREMLWANLSIVTEVPVEKLKSNAATIQNRIETISATVNQRRLSRRDEQTVKKNTTDEMSMVQLAIDELTSPPDRNLDEPIVIREELESHVVVSKVPLRIVAAIESQPHRFHGVSVRGSTQRVYPQQKLASHIIGIRKDRDNSIEEEDKPPYASAEGSTQDDADLGVVQTVGQTGIEHAYDDVLAGQSGIVQASLRRTEKLSEETIVAPGDGRDVTLTLDSRLQARAESLLDSLLDGAPAEDGSPTPQGGCIIVMDIWTGDLLVAACGPRPSLELLAHPSTADWNALLNDSRRPLFPRVTKMALPPGSVFKVVTAVAALESGMASPDELYHCRGYLHSPDQHRCLIYRKHGVGHGEVDLRSALCQSCNVYFYQLAEEMGPQLIGDWANRLGFGVPTGIDITGEVSGAVPSPSGPHRPEHWYPGTTLQLAIGQGSLLATPLQVTSMMATIGNGGYRVTPRVMLSTNYGETSNDPKLKRVPELSERTIHVIRESLEMVVSHPRGTGKSARVDALTLAGKTGTAEASGRNDHAWFAGYAPAQKPRIAYAVVLEHGGSGGKNAGPIVKQMMEALLEYGYLKRD